MKGHLIIVCLFLAGPLFSSASDDTESQGVIDWKNPKHCQGSCPLQDPMDHVIFLKHSDCDKYCSCSNGRPIANRCPPDLFFNTEINSCDRPENVDCTQYTFFNAINFEEKEEEEEVAFETVTPSWQNPDTCKGNCPQVDKPEAVTLLENKDCSKFCMCHMGTKIVKECPAGLIFSLSDQTCSWPYLVKCPQLP
ncbi:peritrophin-1-like [Leptopilina boulardi]|uniref:peritrophin-1-like n=1 Tax=Leptopilina boulardi TaxID=63433 RepID=UPI0021F557EE|nr:peritrophin-1-like [Leptopilina boulardi]